MNDSVSFINSLMALTFVLGLIFLAAYLYKKLAGIKASGLRVNRVPIHIIGTQPLGDKKFLTVVEVEGHCYFLGITANAIGLLDKLQLDLSPSAPEDNGRDFESVFAKARLLLQNRLKK
ncbi:MAG: FliO/MopB family protein [Candidatus Omnitrophota bacterium]